MKRLLIFLLTATLGLFASEVLTLKTPDGFVLKGWLTLPEKGRAPYRLALMSHEYGSDHRMWKELSQEMRRRGYATLEVDLRGHGESQMRHGKRASVHPGHGRMGQDAKEIGFVKIPEDLTAWMEKMDAREDIDIEEPVFFGSSLGGGAVTPLIIDYEPKAVVTLSPASPKNFGLKKAMESAQESASPWLIVTSKGDFARKTAERYAAKAQIPTLIVIPGQAHGSYTIPSAKGYIRAFLDRYLGN
jgi:dienelactone hydrolase